MNSRRSFFRSLAQTAALIALAPQLAFRVRPEVATVPYWIETECVARCTDSAYEAIMAALMKENAYGKWIEKIDKAFENPQTPATT